MRFGRPIVLGLIVFGCDDAVDTLPAGFNDVCEGGSVPWVKNVSGSPAFDSMEVRNGRDAAAGVKTLDKTGTPCAKATDKAACEAAYAAVDLKANGDVAFVATRGNDVIVKNVTQLDGTILGPIDNAHEAAVLATTRERAPLTCEDGQLVGVKRNSGNFEVAVITFDKCTGKKTRVISAVETNGSVRELQTDSLSEGEPKVCER
jgi:hypothetical protein